MGLEDRFGESAENNRTNAPTELQTSLGIYDEIANEETGELNITRLVELHFQMESGKLLPGIWRRIINFIYGHKFFTYKPRKKDVHGAWGIGRNGQVDESLHWRDGILVYYFSKREYVSDFIEEMSRRDERYVGCEAVYVPPLNYTQNHSNNPQ